MTKLKIQQDGGKHARQRTVVLLKQRKVVLRSEENHSVVTTGSVGVLLAGMQSSIERFGIKQP